MQCELREDAEEEAAADERESEVGVRRVAVVLLLGSLEVLIQ